MTFRKWDNFPLDIMTRVYMLNISTPSAPTAIENSAYCFEILFRFIIPTRAGILLLID